MIKKIFIFFSCFFCFASYSYAQACTLSGMTPDKAIPVCGTSVFHQALVTTCTGPNIAQTDCAETVTSDQSFWYKFTCFQSGTLGFLISGISNTDDYDWELFDITGHNPLDVFSNASLRVSLNIYGTSGSGSGAPFPNSPTGCRPSGVGDVHCAGDASSNSPFNRMPAIIIGHDYLLMVTNWTSGSTLGYDLSFIGGTANITDPKEPHMESSRASCDGTQATVKLNKRMKCNSLTASGSEFTITPALANVIAATGFDCSNNFDMDSLILTLDTPLPPGNYTINIQNATDGNTIRDNCDRDIPVNESIPMIVYPLIPTPMDSISKLGCAPDEIQLDFRKNIKCSSIAANGSDFIIIALAGTTAVNVIGASGNCNANGLSPIIKVKLSTPIKTKGSYQIRLVTGNDGNTIIDECAQETPVGATLNFNTKDTVNANFNYVIKYGCQRDTINYLHDGRNEVNIWKWNFDKIRSSSQQNPTQLYGSFGLKKTYLIVSNGICSDTSDTVSILLNNEIKAVFETNTIVCPNETAIFKNKSIGNIISWTWNFGNSITSTLQTPFPQSYTTPRVPIDVFPSLIVQNNFGCFDTATQKIVLPNSCYIAVPNAFTPNRDGLNDYLYPLNAYKVTDLLFRIYNRGGQLVFETQDWTKRWDGRFKGQGADIGTYVWILVYTDIGTRKKVQLKGSSILLK